MISAVVQFGLTNKRIPVVICDAVQKSRGSNADILEYEERPIKAIKPFALSVCPVRESHFVSDLFLCSYIKLKQLCLLKNGN